MNVNMIGHVESFKNTGYQLGYLVGLPIWALQKISFIKIIGNANKKGSVSSNYNASSDCFSPDTMQFSFQNFCFKNFSWVWMTCLRHLRCFIATDCI